MSSNQKALAVVAALLLLLSMAIYSLVPPSLDACLEKAAKSAQGSDMAFRTLGGRCYEIEKSKWWIKK